MTERWVAPLLFWYARAARDLPWRHTRDPYRILVSEIMLQQTRVNAVIPYYERFLHALPTLESLAAVSEDRLFKLWEGLGYYSRARNLKKTAERCVRDFGGTLPADYGALSTLPGLGSYTAGAVASIAFGIPVPAVDGNVLRVLSRLLNDDSDIMDEKTRARMRNQLLPLIPPDAPGAFNQSLMELGATVCAPSGPPGCALCPVRAYCGAHAAGREALLPVKSGKKARRVEEKTVFALALDGALIGKKRPERGLLAGLYQLPEASGFLDAAGMAAFLSSLGLRPYGELSVYMRKHVFTHVEWRMRVCAADVSGRVPDGYLLLRDGHALPTAYRVCIPASSSTTTQRSGAGPTNENG